MHFTVTEVNNDIWMVTWEEGQTQDSTLARILWEQEVKAQPAAARGFAVTPMVVPELVSTPENNHPTAVNVLPSVNSYQLVIRLC